MAKVLMSRTTRILQPGMPLKWAKKRPLSWSIVDVDDPNDMYQLVEIDMDEVEDQVMEERTVMVKKTATKKKAAPKKKAAKPATDDLSDLDDLAGGLDGI